MKQMTDYQRELVEQYLDVVNVVIKKQFFVSGQILLTYEDFYQIGCEALCRAAVRYKPEVGSFVPLAYRCVYNALIDHCRMQNVRTAFKYDYYTDSDADEYALEYFSYSDDLDEGMYLKNVTEALRISKKKYAGIIYKGIEAMELRSLGYTSSEIAKQHSTTVNNVNAWISKARAKLLADEDFLEAIC